MTKIALCETIKIQVSIFIVSLFYTYHYEQGLFEEASASKGLAVAIHFFDNVYAAAWFTFV